MAGHLFSQRAIFSVIRFLFLLGDTQSVLALSSGGRPNMVHTIDDVLENIGVFGRYQYRLLLIMAFMKIFGDGFQMMISTFLSAEPPWRCKDNSTVCNLTGSLSLGDKWYKLRCDLPRSEWEFDTSSFNSIVSEWDLVCELSSLSSIASSIAFAGYLMGVLLGGIVADKFGRRIVVFVPSVLGNVLGLVGSFMTSFWSYQSLRIIVGICVGSSSLAMYVLIVEYAGVRRRHMAGTSLFYFWTLSLMLLALFAYLIRDWRTLSIAGAVPGLLQVFVWWGLPESTRWLLVKGRQKEAVQMLATVARYNQKPMPLGEIGLPESSKAERLGDLRDLFRTLKTGHTTIVHWFTWLVISLVYYGVSFSAGNLGGNRYLVFFLTSIVEIPSHCVAIQSMNKFGRRRTVVVGLLVACLSSMIAVLLQRDLSATGFLVGRIIMAMTAKFFINISFDGIYVHCIELFPTVIRTVGIGSSSAVARIGTISAPFFVGLVDIHVLLPFSIMAVCSFLAAMFCMTLPETKDLPTPESFGTTDRSDTEPNEEYVISEELGQAQSQLGNHIMVMYPMSTESQQL